MMWFTAAVQAHGAAAAHAASEKKGSTRRDHNPPHRQQCEHPLIPLPEIFGIDFSVTKHVFMLWLVALLVFVVVTWMVRRHLAGAGSIDGRKRAGDGCRIRP